LLFGCLFWFLLFIIDFSNHRSIICIAVIVIATISFFDDSVRVSGWSMRSNIIINNILDLDRAVSAGGKVISLWLALSVSAFLFLLSMLLP
jgi:hypothetical protein